MFDEDLYWTRFTGSDLQVTFGGGAAGYTVHVVDGGGAILASYPMGGASETVAIPIGNSDGSYRRGLQLQNAAGRGGITFFDIRLDRVVPGFAGVTGAGQAVTVSFTEKLWAGSNFSNDWFGYESVDGWRRCLPARPRRRGRGPHQPRPDLRVQQPRRVRRRGLRLHLHGHGRAPLRRPRRQHARGHPRVISGTEPTHYRPGPRTGSRPSRVTGTRQMMQRMWTRAGTLLVLLALAAGLVRGARRRRPQDPPPTLTIDPAIEEFEAVRADQRLQLTGTAPAGATIEDIRLFGRNADGTLIQQPIAASVRNRPPTATNDGVQNGGGTIDGLLTLGPPFPATCNPRPGPCPAGPVEVYVELVVLAGRRAGQQHPSPTTTCARSWCATTTWPSTTSSSSPPCSTSR